MSAWIRLAGLQRPEPQALGRHAEVRGLVSGGRGLVSGGRGLVSAWQACSARSPRLSLRTGRAIYSPSSGPTILA